MLAVSDPFCYCVLSESPEQGLHGQTDQAASRIIAKKRHEIRHWEIRDEVVVLPREERQGEARVRACTRRQTPKDGQPATASSS